MIKINLIIFVKYINKGYFYKNVKDYRNVNLRKK